MASKKQPHPGFTIVELLVVIVVIGILAVITIVSYTGISSRAIASSLQSDLSNAATQLKLDQVTNSDYPATLALANGGKGIKASPGNGYQYTYNNATNPQTFCITATNNDQNYYITNDGYSKVGGCLDHGLVLNLDAGNVSSYPGSGTTWTNLSGNGNGTLVNGVAYSAANGGALSFDGLDDYIDLSSINTSSLTKCSVSFWRKSGNTNRWLLLQGQTSAQYIAAVSTGNFYSNNAGSSIVTYEDGNVVVKDNRDGLWHNYVVSGVDLSTWTNLLISNYPGFQYNGLLGNILIYNRSLNADEASRIFNSSRSRFGV